MVKGNSLIGVFIVIWMYTGTPGSGKSYHATFDIYNKLRRKTKNNVIANFPIFTDRFDCKGRFNYVPNSKLTPQFFVEYAKAHHDLRTEAETLVVLDEAGALFNCRDYGTNSNTRMDWIKFFSQHRKLGYNFIMIAQYDRAIDKQIRTLAEYEVAHFKMSNFFKILPGTAFLAVERWYSQKMKVGHTIIVYRSKIANLYDTFALFDTDKSDEELADVAVRGLRGPATDTSANSISNLDVLKELYRTKILHTN